MKSDGTPRGIGPPGAALSSVLSALRTVGVSMGLMLMGFTTISPDASAADPRLEHRIKAAFLYKFSDYVEWPAELLAAGAGLDLCIVGEDPFGRLLDDAVSGERVAGRAFTVKRLDRLSADVSCHIVYVQSSAQPVADILQIAKNMNALSITDKTAEPGIINFVINDNRVRFEIDEERAAASGIKISSRLLNLAVSVRPRSRGDQ